MNEREKDLSDIKSFIEETDKELTLLLQSLQWDRQHLLQGKSLVQCKYDPGHRIPEGIKEKHEEHCFYTTNGYEEEDELLPNPFDPLAKTLVALSNTEIQKILCAAKRADQYFKRGEGCQGEQPMSLARLQATYTPDERRAIHDAVVAAAPACHDLSDLTLISGEESGRIVPKTKLEILAELRNMKRRRMKYRVASKTRNYSDVLRDVIRSQLELYTGVKTQPIQVKPNIMQNEIKIKPTELTIEDSYGQTQQVPDQKGKERKNRWGVNANYKFDDQTKHSNRDRNSKSLGDRVSRPNTSKEYGYQREGRHNTELRDSGNSFREREHVRTEKHRQEREKIHAELKTNGNASTGVERRYNTTEYRYEKEIRDIGKSSREADKRHSTHEEHKEEKGQSNEGEMRSSGDAFRQGERKRHNANEEYRHENEKRYDGKSKNTGNSSREEDKNEKYRYEKERKYERESRDKRKEERSDKNYVSHSHHNGKDKKEKRKRRHSHDHSHSKKHKR